MDVISDNHLLKQMALSLEGIGDAVAITTSDNVFIYVNAAFVEMYGYSKAELLGQHASVVMPPDETVVDDDEVRAAPNEMWEGEGVRVRKGGESFPVHLMLTVIRDEDQNVTASVVVHRDITRSKRIEMENTVLAKIGRIINSSPDVNDVYELFANEVRRVISFDRIAIHVVDLELNKAIKVFHAGVQVSLWDQDPPSEYRITDKAIHWYSPMVFHTEDVREVRSLHPEFLPGFEVGFRSYVSVPLISNDQIIGAMHLRSKTPNAYPDSVADLSMRIATQIAGAVANSGLYAERVRSEEALQLAQGELQMRIERRTSELRDSEENYRSVVETIPHGIEEIDTDGTITFANNALHEMYECESDELIGKSILEFVATDSERKGLRDYLKVLIDQQPDPEPYTGKKRMKSGKVIDVEVAWSYKRDKRGDVIGFVSAITDITERRRAEQLLRENEDQQRRLANENETLAEIGRVISSSLDIDQVYEHFADEVGRLMTFDRIAISIVDTKDQTLIQPYVSGVSIPRVNFGETIPLAGTLTELMMRTRSGLVVGEENIEEICIQFPSHSPNLSIGLRSYIGVPLISNNNVIGTLQFRSLNPNEYSEVDLPLVRRIGDQIAGAIANARLYEERKQAEQALQRSEDDQRGLAEENSVLAEISRIVSSNNEITNLGKALAEQSRKLIPFDSILLHLVDKSGLLGDMEYTHSNGLLLQTGELHHTIKGSITEEVVRVKSGLIFNGNNAGETAKRFPKALPLLQAGIRSFVSVPMMSQGEVIGVLHFRSKELEAYGEGDLRLAERIASQIAGAIAQVQLYAKLEKTQEELRLQSEITVNMAEEALKVSERQYHSLYDNTPVMMHSINREGVLVSVNNHWLSMLGYDRDEVIGQRLSRFLTEDSGRFVTEIAIPQSFRDGSINDIEYQMHRKDGTIIDVLVSAVVEEDDTTGERKTMGFLIDMTERKLLQEQLIQSQKMQAVGTLAGGVAHDYNNMLSAIVSYTHLAISKLSTSDPVLGYLQEVQKAADRSITLTRQLLTFARPDEYFHPEVVDLNEVIYGVERMLRQLINEDIELVVVLEPKTDLVRVDPGQIEQVLMNLALNARDAMPQGGKLIIQTGNTIINETPSRNYAGLEAGEYVNLTVSDTGTGMSEEVRSRVFEPFYTTKEVGKGTGLGLSTTYSIITQAGGRITVESELDQGSCFTISLPAVDEVGNVERKDELDYMPSGSETVLLVEDEPILRRVAAIVLSDQGYVVLEASNGEDALRLAEENASNEIHLLLTDMVMPLMGGRQLAERITSLRPETKVIYMSGYTDEAVALDDGNSFFLPKPLSPSVLTQKVRTVLDGVHLQGSGERC